MARVGQLRTYTIKSGKMQEWIDVWTKGVYPLRLKFGFTIPYAARVEGEDTFVWLVEYDGPEDFETKHREYIESSERKALDPDPAGFIERMETRMLSPLVPREFRP